MRLLPLLLLLGCPAEDSDDTGDTQTADVDGDGWSTADGDCDDSDAGINPDASEICDDLDNDCDDEVDEEATDLSTFYADSDGDGYGDALSTTMACAESSGWVSDDTDCDDTDASTYPGADEFCDDLDNDCDEEIDESDAVDATTSYPDADGDGYGDTASAGVPGCDQPSDYVADNTDCDDTAANTNPGAAEVCDESDNDCDGSVDNGIDLNGDGQDDDCSASFIAVVYADSDSDAQEINLLLGQAGFTSETHQMSATSTGTLDDYDLIIVPSDAGLYSSGLGFDAVQVLQETDSQMLAMGLDGYELYGDMGILIGSSGAGGYYGGCSVNDGTHEVFSVPNDLTGQTNLDLYGDEQSTILIMIDSSWTSVEVLAYGLGAWGFSSLTAEKNKYFSWGYNGGPSEMTTTGQSLLVNFVTYATTQ